MNRVKVWLFTLVLVAGGAVVLRLHAGRLREEAILGLDGRILAGSSHVNALSRATLRETAAAAALSASDPALRKALAPKEEAPPPAKVRGKAPPAPTPPVVDPAAEDADIQAAADAALTASESAMGAPLSAGREVRALNEAVLSRRPVGGETDEFLRGGAAGKSKTGFVRSEGKVWAASGVPVGRGAGLAVLAPLGEAWVRAVALGSGVDVLIAGQDLKPVGTARAAEVGAITSAALRSLGATVDVGTLAPVDVFTKWIPVQLPKLGPLFDSMPAYRARATAVEGVKNAMVIVSASAAPALAPIVALEWRGLVALVAVLLLGILFGFLVKPSEIVSAVPEDLVVAAGKIERGEFDARAPQLAGKLGTIASALNRAAVAASAAAATESASGEKEASSSEFFSSQLTPESQRTEPAFDFPNRSSRARGAEPALTPVPTSRLTGDPFQAAPVSPSATPAPSDIPPVRAPSVSPAPVPSPAAESFSPPEKASSPPPGASPPARTEAPSIPTPKMTMTMPAAVALDEVTHWQQVFEDFVRTRTECGESTEGLTFERFRAKLESNKATLIAKYGCKTVRFQTYVKEGKAALKATPVR